MKPSVRELSATGCGADRAPRPTLFAVGALLFWCSALFLISANLPAVAAAHAGNQYSRVGLVQQGEDGRSYCQRDSADLLADGAADLHVPAVTPKKPMYGVCILQNTQWHKIALENLEPGRHYSIRLSYIALRTHLIDMFLEAKLANGSSIFSSGESLHSKVIVPYKRAAEDSHLVGSDASSSSSYSGIQTIVEQDYGSLLGHDRELLDTSIKFLDPVHDFAEESGEKIEKMYLLIRITPKGLPSGELYNTEAERHKSYATTSSAGDGSVTGNGEDHSVPFFQFDMLVAEKVSHTLDVDILPILLVCTTIFLLMNMYVLRRWQAYIASAPYAARNALRGTATVAPTTEQQQGEP